MLSLKKFGLILSVCALTYISGSHLALVQCVAWGQMLLDYSTESGFASGLSKTFDGDHPCTLCKEVEKARKDQTPQQIVLKLSELKAAAPFANTHQTVRYSSESPTYFSSTALSLGISQEAPPLPPPRA